MTDRFGRTKLAMLAAAAAGIQVGAAITATRFVVDAMGPASLAFLRYAVGVICLIPFVISGEPARFARADIAPIALLGIGQFGVLIALLNYGLQTVPAARGALIFATFPLLTLVCATWLGHERITAFKIGGILCTIVGISLALGDKVLASPGSWTGELAILASAAVGAICSVLYRPYLRRYPTLPVSAFAMFAAAAALAAPAALGDLLTATPRLPLSGWAAVVFIGISSGVGYVVWLWALANTTATRVTIFLALSPVTATLLGATFLAEPISGMVIAGLGCVTLGLWLANRDSERQA